MIHFDEMRHLMGGEIVEHVSRREINRHENDNEPAGGARTPAARLIADRQPLHLDASA